MTFYTELYNIHKHLLEKMIFYININTFFFQVHNSKIVIKWYNCINSEQKFISDLQWNKVKDLVTVIPSELTLFSAVISPWLLHQFSCLYTRGSTGLLSGKNQAWYVKIKTDNRFSKCYIQARSHYGLISKNEIVDPVVTPVTAWVPYYHGFLYAAYQAEDSREVGIVWFSEL